MKAPDGVESHVVVERGDLFGVGRFVVVGPKGAESQGFRDRATAERWARRARAEYARRRDVGLDAALARVRRRRATR